MLHKMLPAVCFFFALFSLGFPELIKIVEEAFGSSLKDNFLSARQKNSGLWTAKQIDKMEELRKTKDHAHTQLTI